jgi:uncharacterized radical SAM superfamily Fe-S cluster-containing enzyme
MVELTIEITNYCPENCIYCSSNATAVGKHLDFEVIKQFIQSNRPLHTFGDEPNYKPIDRINISGGEPLSHPQFYQILKMCENSANEVVVYTNAIKILAYNASVIDGVTLIANVPLVPNIDIHLPPSHIKTHFLKFIPQGRGKDIKPLNIHLSSNLLNCGYCETCDNKVLKADGTVAMSPCRKDN